MGDQHERSYALSESAKQIGIVTISRRGSDIASAYARVAWIAQVRRIGATTGRHGCDRVELTSGLIPTQAADVLPILHSVRSFPVLVPF